MLRFKFEIAASKSTGAKSLIFWMSQDAEQLGCVYVDLVGAGKALKSLLDGLITMCELDVVVKPVNVKGFSERVRIKRWGIRGRMQLGINFGTVSGANSGVSQEHAPIVQVLGQLEMALEHLMRIIEKSDSPPKWRDEVAERLGNFSEKLAPLRSNR